MMSSKLKCKSVGHQKKEILGLCVYELCTKTSAFCQDCLYPKYGEFHQGHQQYCLEFNKIKNYVLQELDLFTNEILNFQTCYKLLIGLKERISKIFQINIGFYYQEKQQKDKELVEHQRKISQIIVKLYHINFKIQKKVQELRLINASLYNCYSKKFNTNEFKIKYFPYRKFGLFQEILRTINQFEINFQVRNIEEEIRRIGEKLAQVHFLKGQQLEGKAWERKSTDALIEYSLAISCNKQFIEAYIAKAEQLFKFMRFDEMNECLELVLEINKDNFEILILKGKMLIQQGRCEQAIKYLNYASQLGLNNYGSTLKDFEYFFQKVILLFKIMMEYSNLEIKCVDKYIQMKMNEPWGLKKKVLKLKLNYQIVEILQSFQELDKAIQYCDLFIKYNPGQIDGYQVKAKILVKPNENEKAIECWDKYLAQKPQDYYGYYYKASILHDKQKVFQCWDDYIFNNESTKFKGFERKAMELFNMNENEKSIQCWDQYISCQPQTIEAYIIKAKILVKMNEIERAIKCLDQFILRNPENYEGYHEKAKLLKDINKPEKAIECLEQFILRSPKIYKGYYHKAEILLDMNEQYRAIKCWDQFILCNPENYEGYHEKAKLEDLYEDDLAIECLEQYILKQPEEFYIQNFLKSRIFEQNFFQITNENDHGQAIQFWKNCIFSKSLDYENKPVLEHTKKSLKVIECLDQYIFVNPHESKGYYYKTNILQKLSDFEKAIECWDQQSFCSPETYYIFIPIVDLLKKQNENEKALKFLDQLLFFQFYNHCNGWLDDIYFKKARLLWDLQQYNEAIQCKRLVVCNPFSRDELAEYFQFV